VVNVKELMVKSEDMVAGQSSGVTLMIDPEVLKRLVCPLTHSPLRQENDRLIAAVGGLRYPIREGIPVLLVDEAGLPEGVGSLEEFKQRFCNQVSRSS
jgi:uncharacterized protein YbaR (Trm112 family)